MKTAWNFRDFNDVVFRLSILSSERARNAFIGDRIPRGTWIPFPWFFAPFMICVDFHGLKNKIAVVALGDCITLKEEVCGKV